MLDINNSAGSISSLEELCTRLGVSQEIAERLVDNDIEEIMSYANEDGFIELKCGQVMSVDMYEIVVSNPDNDDFSNYLSLTGIDCYGEGEFWEIPLEYAMRIISAELSGRGLKVL